MGGGKNIKLNKNKRGCEIFSMMEEFYSEA